LRGPCQHLLGDEIRLLLVNVAGLVDLKLRLRRHHVQRSVDTADSELRLKRLCVKMRPDRLGTLSGSRLGWIERVAAGTHNVGRHGARRAVLSGRCGHARRRGGSPVWRGAQYGADPRAIGLGLRPAGGAHRRRDRPPGPVRGGNVASDARLHGSRFLPSCASVDRAACSFTQTPKYRVILASAISARPTAVRTISCSLVDLICGVERLYTAAGGDDHAPRAKPGGVVVLQRRRVDGRAVVPEVHAIALRNSPERIFFRRARLASRSMGHRSSWSRRP